MTWRAQRRPPLELGVHAQVVLLTAPVKRAWLGRIQRIVLQLGGVEVLAVQRDPPMVVERVVQGRRELTDLGLRKRAAAVESAVERRPVRPRRPRAEVLR